MLDALRALRDEHAAAAATETEAMEVEVRAFRAGPASDFAAVELRCEREVAVLVERGADAEQLLGAPVTEHIAAAFFGLPVGFLIGPPAPI